MADGLPYPTGILIIRQRVLALHGIQEHRRLSRKREDRSMSLSSRFFIMSCCFPSVPLANDNAQSSPDGNSLALFLLDQVVLHESVTLHMHLRWLSVRLVRTSHILLVLVAMLLVDAS
jgi:hypothetical protein